MSGITLSELLKKMIEMGGSDLHITTNSAPRVRVHGHLRPLDMPPLTAADTKSLAYSVLTDAQKHRFEENLELDFSFGLKNLARFRGNVFNQRGAVGSVFRTIPWEIKGFDALGLPTVIKVICEMRDLETIESALRIAETGHLTFATLHTNSASSTINRIIDVFPSHQQPQIRAQLSMVIEGILCQALLPRPDGRGRAMVMEVLIPTPAIRNLIREDKIHQIYSAMQTGTGQTGMQTFNQGLANAYFQKLITLDMAISRSSNADELQDMINRGVSMPGAGSNKAPVAAKR